ncbi:hypothetical protein EVAR_75954_1 [Eumeta japonica]|uniref:Uncharacterized protein n=1 Tax=Eumeta variegata TaxID=151549 RepID=A0A4C1UWX1_EUMVA|nr:hypothetical protein EVAR_75954_1 [Eumeta japonica]
MITSATIHVSKKATSRWKQQRLVLLPKGKKPPKEPSFYRPLYMLDTAGCDRWDSMEGRNEEILFGGHFRHQKRLQLKHGSNLIRLGMNKNLSQQESYNRLRLAFHDDSPFIAIVYNWSNKFERGRTNLTEDLLERHPYTATTEVNISAVRLMMRHTKNDLRADLDKLRHWYESIAQNL